MKTTIELHNGTITVDLSRPIDISLKLEDGNQNPNAWYIGKPKIEPIRDGSWVAKVSKGASINFNKIEFSPHAHGTHTESYGHISAEFHSISECLKQFFFKAKLISIAPLKLSGDQMITKSDISQHLKLNQNDVEALIIRTLPNKITKKHKDYDHTNWPYLEPKAAEYIRKCGIEHLLIDLPSVDREEGEVLAHQLFWNYPRSPRKNATITEFIYVPDEIKDGLFLLNLQVANFENDAAPSRPVLYEIL